jgi:hypothetical protein
MFWRDCSQTTKKVEELRNNKKSRNFGSKKKIHMKKMRKNEKFLYPNEKTNGE